MRKGITLTRIDIIKKLNDELGLSKREAARLLEQFFGTICSTLEKGEQVKVSGFGNFNLRDKRERPGRNPITSVSVPVSARRVAIYKPSRSFRKLLEHEAGIK